jgi:SAM-dependent methyltransferase
MIAGDDDPAAGTARWLCIIDDPAQACTNPLLCSPESDDPAALLIGIEAGSRRGKNDGKRERGTHPCAAAPLAGTSAPVNTPTDIFDRNLRRLRRDRAASGFADHAFLREAMIEGLLDRLDLVTRPFTDALDLGCADGTLTQALRARSMTVTPVDAGAHFASAASGIQCDEDRLPFQPASFDLIMSAGVLDTVNDLPGALVQCRRALRPDGLFLAAFLGVGSLPTLRDVVRAADSAAEGAMPQRFHPLIDVPAAGDLLVRAGFTLPVTDSETIDVRYGSPLRLMADLRGMAAGNQLAGQTPPALGRGRLAEIARLFAERAEPDGRTRENFTMLFMTGWAPGPNQPQPAKRGSATTSLAAALKPRSE